MLLEGAHERAHRVGTVDRWHLCGVPGATHELDARDPFAVRRRRHTRRFARTGGCTFVEEHRHAGDGHAGRRTERYDRSRNGLRRIAAGGAVHAHTREVGGDERAVGLRGHQWRGHVHIFAVRRIGGVRRVIAADVRHIGVGGCVDARIRNVHRIVGTASARPSRSDRRPWTLHAATPTPPCTHTSWRRTRPA